MNKHFTWQVIASILRSPAVRATALIPVLGYFILFSRDLNAWMNTYAIGSGFWIETPLKIRMLYYGAVSLGISLSIYYFVCPRTIKKHASKSDAIDGYYEGSRPRKVHEAALRQFYITDLSKPMLPADTHYGNTLAYLDGAILEYLAAPRAREALTSMTTSLEDQNLSVDKRYVERLKRRREEIDEVYKHHIEHPNDINLNRLGAEVIEREYELDLIRNTYWRMITAFFAITGFALVVVCSPESGPLFELVPASDMELNYGQETEA